MTDAVRPTEEGKLRYPGYTDNDVDPPEHYAAGFNHSFNPPIPCTCTPTCQARCAGECGCAACRMAFADYANMRGWFWPKGEPQEPALDQQLEEYRRALGPQKRP
ncbi:hypothetical protein CH75_09425 [Dyella jiangningensis]|nr:hypothetical protein CH75_09425 [Dyella jiangningensis]